MYSIKLIVNANLIVEEATKVFLDIACEVLQAVSASTQDCARQIQIQIRT